MSECSICTIEISDVFDGRHNEVVQNGRHSEAVPCCQCKHKIHIKCLKMWYEVCLKDDKEPSCPNCRHCHCENQSHEKNCCGEFLLIFHQQKLREKINKVSESGICNEVHIELIREIRNEDDSDNEDKSSSLSDPTVQGIIFILSAFLALSVGIGFLASTYDPDNDGYLE